MNSVPFLDLKAQYAGLREEVEEAVRRTLASTTYVLGPEVAAFEEEFAALHGAAYGVAMNSGTSALHAALLAAGVGPGDEVITVSMTFIATAAAIRYVGASPVFVDVDPRSCTMDVSQMEARITPRTRAIVPVHLYGQAAEMDSIMAAAHRHGLIVIEDAAQAHAARYHGRPVGSLGHMAAFSFYPGKNLGAYGEGGIVLTSDPQLVQSLRLLRDWGQGRKYHHEMLAFNYRMDAVQGAILRVKLRHLPRWTEARRAHAELYRRILAPAGLQTAVEEVGRTHVYHIFSVFHPRRNALRDALAAAGIQTGIHYPVPVHLQPPFADLGYRPGDLPITERIARQQLSLPMYPELSERQIEHVCLELLRSTERLATVAAA
jgi:dTDP-4-amino-4,6-dideoxygalactose transaminase